MNTREEPIATLISVVVILLGIGFIGLLWIRWVRHQRNTLQSGKEVRPSEDNAEKNRQFQVMSSSPPASVPNTVSYLIPIPKIPRPPSIYDTSREPGDESDLIAHPHERYFPPNGGYCSLNYGWQIIGASRRGYAHMYEGKYREDDFNIRLVGKEMALIAIADGLGSKAMSRRGARASVLGATSLPAQQLQGLIQLVKKDAQHPMCEQEAHMILVDALHAARAHVEERAREDQIDIEELQTTLLVFLAIPYDQKSVFVGSVQIGDGALFALQLHKGIHLSNKWRWLQPPQLQASGNEVEPFTRTDLDTWRRFLQCELLHDTTFIMGMTDGTAADIEPPRETPENPNPDPFLYVDDFYQNIKSRVLNEEQPAEALLEFLSYRKRLSYDDRTLICLYCSKEGSQDYASPI